MGLKAEKQRAARERRAEHRRRVTEVVKGGPEGVKAAVALGEEVEPEDFPAFVAEVFPRGGMDVVTFNALCDGYDLYAHARAVAEAPLVASED